MPLPLIRYIHGRWIASLGLCALVLSLSAWPVSENAAAQEPSPPEVETPEEPAAEPAEKPFREQTIYIPYDELRKVFEKEGRGVFLPYDRFQELWKAAREASEKPPQPELPTGALITEIDAEATVAKDVVKVAATVKIEVLAEGWSAVDLRLADAAITKATLDGKPARITGDAQSGYRLLVEKKGTDPKSIELALEYAKRIDKQPGRNRVSFQAPRAPVSRWQVRIPERGAEVKIHPLIAATEQPEEDPAADAGETVLLAFVGAAPSVSIEWTPKAEGATGLEALADVQAEQEVRIVEGLVETTARLAYRISRAELAQLVIDVPADQNVAEVSDPDGRNVRKWAVAKSGAVQTITVDLHEPADATQNITVRLQQFAAEGDAGAENNTAEDTTAADSPAKMITIPVVEAKNVGRQQGNLVIDVDKELRSQADPRSGLLQIDAGELPAALAGRSWTYSYRCVTVPFEMDVTVEKIQPRILADSVLAVQLETERLRASLVAVFTVERAGVFRLEADVPADYEVLHVGGISVAGAEAADVANHVLEGPEKTRLVVNLRRQALGRVALVVRLEQKLDALQPGESVELPVPLARVAPEGVERVTGRLIVSAPASLEVTPATAEGLGSITFDEAIKDFSPTALSLDTDSQPVLTRDVSPGPVTLTLNVKRLEPEVTIRQLMVARIEHGVVTYRSTFFYDILYSSVETLRLDVPAELVDEIRITTDDVEKKQADPQPDDVEEGYVACLLSGKSDFSGSGQFELTWKELLEDFAVGARVKIDIPWLRPAEVDRAWGQIVVGKTESVRVRPLEEETRGVLSKDPQHDLMPGAEVRGGALLFEFRNPWKLAIAATRFELEQIKTTCIESALLRMVVTRGNQVSVQALYRIRSAGAQQRLAMRLPEGAEFDANPLWINGEPVTPETEKAGDRQFSVPLIDSDETKPFLLELRYTYPLTSDDSWLSSAGLSTSWSEGGRLSGTFLHSALLDGKAIFGVRLDCPEFPDEPAVLETTLCVYLPEQWTPLHASGPWTDEFAWTLDAAGHWQPGSPSRDPVGKVIGQVGVAANRAGSFPTDGRQYVFSTLRPEAPPDGSLIVPLMHEDLVNSVVFALALVGGIVLLPFGMMVRVLCIGAAVAALVLLGVFLPILAYQIIDAELAAAVAVVLVLWVVWYFVWTRRRRKRRAMTAETGKASWTAGSDALADRLPPPSEPRFPSPPVNTPGNETSLDDMLGSPLDDDQPPADAPEDDRSEGGQDDA